MQYPRSILNALLVFILALAIVPVAQASIYAIADGVNSNALERLRAQKRAQQQQYRDIVRNPLRLFRRQESTDNGTPLPTDMTSISNTSTTSAPESTTSEPTSMTTLETTSDGITSTSDNSEPTDSSTTDESTSSTEAPPDQTPSTEVPPETSTSETPPPETTTTEGESIPPETTPTEDTSTIPRTTLDTTVKSAYTTPISTSIFTLPDGAVSTITQFLVVVPTISPPPTRAQDPQETESVTGTASLHTNAAAPAFTPGPGPMVAMMAALGYIVAF